MSTNRDIRDKYTKIIGALAKKHGAPASNHEIAREATLAQCIGFTKRFVVGRASDTPHYRYDRYRRVLDESLQRNPINSGNVIHIDVGCGPGLFTWVVVDYFRSKPSINVTSYGYDHAPKMVKLARCIWKRLDETNNYFCYHNVSKVFDSRNQERSNKTTVIVTFGHVLIQTLNNGKAHEKFVDIISSFSTVADCRVIAVDAQKIEWREMFDEAWGQLKSAMERRGLIVDTPCWGWSQLWTTARARSRA